MTAETEIDPNKLAKELRESLTIVIKSKAWAYGGYGDKTEEELELIHVVITTKDPLDSIIIAGHVINALRLLQKVPEAEILP